MTNPPPQNCDKWITPRMIHKPPNSAVRRPPPPQIQQIPNKRLQYSLDEFTQEREGALEEPRVDVQSVHSTQRNPRTGEALEGLAPPALESLAPHNNPLQPVHLEANDTWIAGGGLRLPELEDDDLETYEFLEDDESESLLDYSSDEETTYRIEKPTGNQQTMMLKGPKPGLKIGSINVRGKTITTGAGNDRNKIKLIIKWMSEHKIAILALIDTHWDESTAETIKQTYRNHQILHSNESTNRGGVAFIIDERIAKPESTNLNILIPGRSAELEAKYENQKIHMITVYVPNEKKEKISVIKKLRKAMEKMKNKNDIVLTGDFNMVERETDRSPPHNDDYEIVREMTKLKASLNLVDGWRSTNPGELQYTWKGPSKNDHSFSRIDRIYVNEEMMTYTNEWSIIETEDSLSDHSGVTVTLLEPNPPFIGRGEWRLNLKIMEHPHLIRESTRLIKTLQKDLQKYARKTGKKESKKEKVNATRRTLNPQLAWIRYKEGIQTATKVAQTLRKNAIEKERNEILRISRSLRGKLRDMDVNDEDEGKEIRRQLNENEKKLSEMMEQNRKKAEATVISKLGNAAKKQLRYSS
jgi:exonuclease III